MPPFNGLCSVMMMMKRKFRPRRFNMAMSMASMINEWNQFWFTLTQFSGIQTEIGMKWKLPSLWASCRSSSVNNYEKGAKFSIGYRMFCHGALMKIGKKSIWWPGALFGVNLIGGPMVEWTFSISVSICWKLSQHSQKFCLLLVFNLNLKTHKCKIMILNNLPRWPMGASVLKS